jgi:hypothetical protein
MRGGLHTLKSIANNAEIDVIWEKFQETLEPLRAQLNAALGKQWEEWEIPPARPGDSASGPWCGETQYRSLSHPGRSCYPEGFRGHAAQSPVARAHRRCALSFVESRRPASTQWQS